ncbi:MAG: ABC transporter substrate-binding protein [Alphaproteobacteria bacterium]
MDYAFRAIVVGLALIAGVAHAAPPGPRDVVERLYQTLGEVVREADTLGYEGRFQRLAPVLAEVYDFPMMTRLAAGPAWGEASEEQRLELITAFRAMSIATYARRFDGGAVRYEVLDDREFGPGDVVVRTRLVPSDGESVALDYRLRESEVGWRIVDVYLTGTISELATRRSEFAAIARDQGIDGLIRALEAKAAP